MKYILLLEDDRSIVDLLSTLLEGDGYYISSTARVADATQILRKTKVDLLVADIVCPIARPLPLSMRRKGETSPAF